MLVLGTPTRRPALGGHRFLRAAIPLSQCLVLQPRLPLEGAPHCSRSFPKWKPQPDGPQLQETATALGTKSKPSGGCETRGKIHPLSSQTSSPAPPPHSTFQPPGVPALFKKQPHRAIPGSLVAKILPFYRRGHGFNRLSRNQDPACHIAWPKNKNHSTISDTHTLHSHPCLCIYIHLHPQTLPPSLPLPK